ncbi:MAG: hybrid sensor histidine kinase/response regulator [Verrucomicrobiota bacterium]
MKTKDTSKGVILIADDHAPNRKLLADSLKAVGYEVRTANDGAEALQLCACTDFDTILLDIMMPHLTGYEVCAHLRNQERTENIPVLLVSALTSRGDRIEGVEAGANDFLVKPVDIQDLTLRVRNAVRMKRQHDQIKEHYQQLQELEQMRDNLTHMVVHDMRNLVLGVSGNLDLLKLLCSKALTDAQLQTVVQANHASAKLLQMIESLLDISRLEEGKIPVTPDFHDFRQLAGDVIEDLGARTFNVTIEVAAESNSMIWCDRELIRRVMQNLVGNAIDFVPEEKGRIQIRFEQQAGGDSLISVSDNGPGVPKEAQDRIFEKFVVDKSISSVRRSSGLGLAFCKLAVEAHGGNIGIESQSESGSRFWFVAPAPSDTPIQRNEPLALVA